MRKPENVPNASALLSQKSYTEGDFLLGKPAPTNTAENGRTRRPCSSQLSIFKEGGEGVPPKKPHIGQLRALSSSAGYRADEKSPFKAFERQMSNPSNQKDFASRQLTISDPPLRLNTQSSKRELEEGNPLDLLRSRYEQVIDVEEDLIPPRVFDLNTLAEVERFLAADAAAGRVLCVASDMFVPSFAFLDALPALLIARGLKLATANFDEEAIQRRFEEHEIPATFFVGKDLVFEGCDLAAFTDRLDAEFPPASVRTESARSASGSHLINLK